MSEKSLHKISAIVPAHNEEKRIEGVLKVLVESPDIDEVICINDGSTDRTLEIAKSVKGVKVLSFKKNCGKACAVAKGVVEATGNIVIFVDADLVGFTSESIHSLVAPLKTNKYDAAIGYRGKDTDNFAFKPLSGERAYFRKDILPLLGKIKDKGYGLELYLNYTFKDKQVKLLALKGVAHTLKHKKQPLNQAAKLFVVEIVDILSEIFRQKNPVKYFIYAYLQSFYIKK
jgi:glycosyltransferase involved in cell wall biosynthesis